MKKILIVIALVFAGNHLVAQPPNLDSIKLELYKINKLFDSSRYLGFDVHIRYSSDTAYGKYDFEEMTGKYILNQKNIWYKMGDIEYVQNDSFAYDIYHDEKTLVMTRDSISSKSSLFPLKEFVDSMLTWYAASYTISLRDEDDSRVIEFTTEDTLAPYRRFAIYYEPTTYYPDKFEMYFIEGNQIPSSVDYLEPTRKTITMSFSNYYNPSSMEIFEDTNYVFFDRGRRQYRPSEKYRMYKFIANGMAEGEDETVELYPPPDDNQ